MPARISATRSSISRAYLAERMGLKTKAAFLHLPLDVSQTAEQAPGSGQPAGRHLGRSATDDSGGLTG